MSATDVLVSEGVEPWLEAPAAPAPAATLPGVRGVLLASCDPVAAALACDELLPLGGLVAMPPPDPGYGAAAGLLARLGRTNLLVVLPATPTGLDSAARLLGEGAGVHTGPVRGLAAYEAVLEAWLCGLERAQDRGLDLAAIPSYAGVPIRELGDGAIGTARLLYARQDRTLATGRWRVLAAAGARPQRLMWTSLGPRSAALPSLIGWGTAAALPTLAPLPRLYGDTLSHT
ncbi:hypothetical protein ACGFYQ_18205 [Streptomyces sp. NPDC048258]|uniref:hypothetical protein n=1 Tax=Streptomyces sp. NPDC048258 TaxID=3365527 RepID=UPI00371925A9